jgi:hypothetical protein
MDLRIDIAGDEVVCRQDGTKAFSAPLKDFLRALGERTDAPPLSEAIPEGVRFIRRRGEVVVVVLEEKPQLRTVRWLADESSVPFGKGATYRTARLAFPFIVAAIAFRDGRLTGYQQCFYRTEPLAGLSDPLLLPNLYNVADGYGQKCWLCLASLQTDLGPLSWGDRVREIRRHLWGAGFNRSSEVHEGMSYWTTLRKVDRRFDTLDAWERASLEDPFFPLGVGWKPAGRTVGDVLEEMIGCVGPPTPTTVAHLAHLLSRLPPPSSARSLLVHPSDDAR